MQRRFAKTDRSQEIRNRADWEAENNPSDPFRWDTVSNYNRHGTFSVTLHGTGPLCGSTFQLYVTRFCVT